MGRQADAGVRRHAGPAAGLVGILGYGVGTYGFLVVAGRVLGPGRFADLSVVWTAVFLGTVGLLVPIEQEGARSVGTAVAVGADLEPVQAEVQASALVVAVGAAAAVVLAAPVLGPGLFDGHVGFVGVLAASLLAYGFVHGQRAVLVGTGRLHRFAALLLVDTVARLGLTGLAVVVGLRSGLGLALAVPASPLVAVLVVTPGALRVRRAPGGLAPLVRRTWPLIVAALAGQLVVTFPALAARALADPSEDAVIGSYLASLSLGRAPILLFGAFEAAMVPALTAHAAHGRYGAIRSLMVRYLAVVAAVGAASTVVGAFALRPVLRIGFGAGFGFDRLAVVLVLGGTGCCLLALVVGQGLLTLRRRRDLVVPWAVALVLEIAVVAGSSGGLPRRTAAAFALGSAGAAVTGALLLRRGLVLAERSAA